jgi:hypothetical protein
MRFFFKSNKKIFKNQKNDETMYFLKKKFKGLKTYKIK